MYIVKIITKMVAYKTSAVYKIAASFKTLWLMSFCKNNNMIAAIFTMKQNKMLSKTSNVCKIAACFIMKLIFFYHFTKAKQFSHKVYNE